MIAQNNNNENSFRKAGARDKIQKMESGEIMLPFIKETETAWDRLKNTKKPIVLYGMGNGADKILDWCENNAIAVAAIFASDDFVRGQSFRGYKVCRYADIAARYEDFLIVIAFASESPHVLDNFYQLAPRHETLAPHLPLFAGDETVSFAWLEQYGSELKEVYDRLADDKSREVFAAVLNYKLCGRIEYLKAVETSRREDCRELFPFGSDEVHVDLGAYDGDTIKEFLDYTGGCYRQIFAFEPDVRNFRKLQNYVTAAGLERIVALNKGAWSEEAVLGFSAGGGRQSALGGSGNETEVCTVDGVVGGERTSYIKFDVEGAEFEALLGAGETIRRWHPKLFLAAYHRDNDLWRLPLLLWSIEPSYELYLRKHPYVPAWELNYLAVARPQPKGQ